MMVKREYLVRHPDRCTHNAVCIPVCPTGAWLSTPPFKFDAPRCLESCRLCLDACPSQACASRRELIHRTAALARAGSPARR